MAEFNRTGEPRQLAPSDHLLQQQAQGIFYRKRPAAHAVQPLGAMPKPVTYRQNNAA